MRKPELIKFNLIKTSLLAVSALIFLFSMSSLEKLLLKFFNIEGSVWINLFDEKIFFWINSNQNDSITPLMLTITHIGSIISWFGVALLLYFLKKRREAFILVFALLIGGVATFFMKIGFHRLRPFQILVEAKALDIEEDFSFPSGHAVNSFSSATILGKKENKKILIALYALALLVSYSRVYIGVHWPSDVIFGGLIGVVNGFLILKFEEKILKIFINEAAK